MDSHAPPTGSNADPEQHATLSSLNGKKAAEASPTVRFASTTEEFEPPKDLQPLNTGNSNEEAVGHDDETIKELTKTLQGSRLQERRMSNFAFEPVSLPASRIHSNEDSSREATRHNTNNSTAGRSPNLASMHSPPITPAATRSRDTPVETATKGALLQRVEPEQDPAAVTPQISPPGASPTSTSSTHVDDSRPGSSGVSTRLPSQSAEPAEEPKKHHAKFSIGPTHDSVPASREVSPTRSAAPTYSRPFAPSGDPNDPFAAHKRKPQSKNLDAIDQRFKFQPLGSKHRPTSSSSSVSLPRSSRSAVDVNPNAEKRHSHIFGGNHKDHLSHVHDDSTATLSSKHGSMSELKRFLKIGSHHKSKRTGSPTPSTKSGNSGTRTPPHHKTPQQLPFDDNHGLTSKYGKFGKVLGAGAGGSVRLMKRSSDNTTFAVKEFRARHSYETEKEYAKKVTAEFCIGSTLHHGNIIETMDIIHEKGRWYEVMEYAPYDLFAIVMTGKMSREEISCSFLQILSGVTYLHSMGLAHRDMKLDNVVVNERGIMKIIDFGSASVFKYPFENGITLASGIVGSDPYLAPEVYDERKYDPQPTDIWSLAIIFCCMSLRRFPWKMPRMTDNSYKLFASTPTPGAEIRRLSDAPSKSMNDLDTPARDAVADASKPSTPKSEHPPSSSTANTSTTGAPSTTAPSSSTTETAPSSSSTTTNTTTTTAPAPKPEVIKGPWRLLRLLPRESRHIMGRMLEIDPRNRATLTEILDDPWVSGTEICREELGKTINVKGHTHTLVPPQGAGEGPVGNSVAGKR